MRSVLCAARSAPRQQALARRRRPCRPRRCRRPRRGRRSRPHCDRPGANASAAQAGRERRPAATYSHPQQQTAIAMAMMQQRRTARRRGATRAASRTTALSRLTLTATARAMEAATATARATATATMTAAARLGRWMRAGRAIGPSAPCSRRGGILASGGDTTPSPPQTAIGSRLRPGIRSCGGSMGRHRHLGRPTASHGLPQTPAGLARARRWTPTPSRPSSRGRRLRAARFRRTHGLRARPVRVSSGRRHHQHRIRWT